MATVMFTNMSASSPCSRGRTGGASRRPCFIMASPRPRPNPPSTRCAASPSGERNTASSPDESKRRDGEYYPSKVLWPGIEKTDAYLRKMDFRAKKSLGQNFMIQENVLSKTVAYAGVQKGDRVLEIGSGTGNLTRYMLAKGAEVVCVEKDDRLHEAFVKEFEEEVKSKRLKVVHADVMRWLTERDRRERELVASGGSVDQMLRFDKVVANLPFNITTDLLKFLLPRCESVFRPPTGSPESRPSGDVFLLLQDEAARRLCECRAGDSNYRAMNVLVDCFCSSTEYLFKIDRKAFFPAPNVDGALAHFKILPREEALSVGQVGDTVVTSKQFHTFVNQCFSRRRKMVKNNIPSNMFGADEVARVMEELDLGAETRPQDLSCEQYLSMLHKLQGLKNSREAESA